VKALSLTQPWATLVAIGAKRVETRSWSTNHRGTIAIHASKGFPADCRRLCWDEPFRSTLLDLVDFGSYSDLDEDSSERFSVLPLGAIVAVAKLTAVEKTEFVTSMSQGLLVHEIEFGDYTRGRFAWFLQDVRKLPVPIPCKGALGLWDVPAAILEAIAPQLLLTEPQP